MTKHLFHILVLVLLLFMIACDPAIRYEPKDWTQISPNRWSKTFGQIDVETDDIGGFIASTSLYPELSIHNRAKTPAVVESAVLKTGEAEYLARPPRHDWGKWSVAPGATQRLELDWKFENDNPLYKALKDPVAMILKVRVGNELLEVIIPMRKSV